MVKCPWGCGWEGQPEKYSGHLEYCKKYPPNIEAMSLRKTDAELREIARTLLPIELMFFKAGKGWMLDRLAGLSKEEFSRLEEIVKEMYSRKSPEQSARSPEELPPGMCYREAYRFVLKEGDHLIHGKITSPADKRVVNHAWVEFDTGWVWEPQTEKFMRKAEFEQFFEPKVEAKYTPKEAMGLALKSRHYGPWHEILEEHSSDGFTNIEFSFEENPHTRTDYHMGNVVCYYLLLNGKQTRGLAEICTKDIAMLRQKDPQFYEHMNVTWHFCAFANFWDELNEALDKPFKDYSGWDKVGFPITQSYDYKGTSNEAKQYFLNFFKQVADKVQKLGHAYS